MIKAVFFDLDDTLCDDTAAWRECALRAARHGASLNPKIDAERLAESFLSISERYWMSLDYMMETRGLLELRTGQFRQALHEIGSPRDDQAAIEMARLYGAIRSKDIALFPDVATTLEALRARGMKLACITNGLAATHEAKVVHLGLDSLCDHVLIADRIGHFKPDPRIFERALELCDCAPNEAIMVGDDLIRDVGGAQSAGILACWFNPHRRTRKPSDPVPYGEFSQISEILDDMYLSSQATDRSSASIDEPGAPPLAA